LGARISAGRCVRLDHLRHGEGLARAGDAEQHLVALVLVDAVDEFGDGGRLSPSRPPGACACASNRVCGGSAKPRVAGVPAAVSAGGGSGLPDLPREGRGALPAPDFGVLAMGGNMECSAFGLK
jgi:hypothetical protein